MSLSGILDAILILLLCGYLSIGWILGFLRSLFALGGLVAGAVGAFLLAPIVGSWVGAPEWRPLAVIVSVIFLLAAGQTLGLFLGRMIARSLEGSKLGILDRLGGMVLNLLVAALVVASAAFSLGSLGAPWLSQAISNSAVLRSINALTPAPIQQAMAQLRSIIVQQGIPRIISAAEGGIDGGSSGGSEAPPTAPPAPSPIPSPDAPPLQKAAASVVRVTGSAYQCGQDQSGSGFVVSDGRVITNAHVVAGVDEPVVEIPGVTALPGKVVYFDPRNDLAVIAVPGLKIAPLELGGNLAVGSAAVFDGYPYGGPFQSSPARVDQVFTVRVNDIYGANPAPLEVYQLAAEVHEGNSGGPLLDTSGRVVGLVFAKSANTSGVGYALTMAELEPVADQAAALSSKVSSGHCVRR